MTQAYKGQIDTYIDSKIDRKINGQIDRWMDRLFMINVMPNLKELKL